MKRRESFDVFKARNRNNNELVMMVRVKNALDAERIESHFKQLKDCDSEFLVRCCNTAKKDSELWVVTPCPLHGIAYNGVQRFTLDC